MQTASLDGGFSDIPVESARAFRAALDALSRPGEIQTLKGAVPPAPLSPAAGALALILCGPDTPIWLAPSCADQAVVDWFRFHTGAEIGARREASFAFGRWEEMLPLSDFRIGVAEYPDRSATLIVERDDLGTAHRLTGPGIETEARLTVPDVASLQDNRALFPLGLDFFLTCGDRVAGLPRTTFVEG